MKNKLIIIIFICAVFLASLTLSISIGFNYYKNNGQTVSETVYKLPAKIQMNLDDLEQSLEEAQQTNLNLVDEYNNALERINDLEKQDKEIKNQLADIQNKPAPEQDNSQKIAYLTFDDGPSSNTEKILDILKENNIKATFFVVAKENDFGKRMYNRVINEGHSLGVHCYYHAYSNVYGSIDSYIYDFEKIVALIQNDTGYTPDIMRFPGGAGNASCKKYGGDIMPQIIDIVHSKSFEYYDWNVNDVDTAAALVPKDTIVRSVLNGANNKREAIILCHDSAAKTTTVEALPEIIEGLKVQGFSFDKITRAVPAIQQKPLK